MGLVPMQFREANSPILQADPGNTLQLPLKLMVILGTTMYLNLPAPYANPQLVGWREVSSLATLIGSYLTPPEALASLARPVPGE